jgi:hypothetical protein
MESMRRAYAMLKGHQAGGRMSAGTSGGRRRRRTGKTWQLGAAVPSRATAGIPYADGRAGDGWGSVLISCVSHPPAGYFLHSAATRALDYSCRRKDSAVSK